MDNGWISIHRKIMNKAWYKNSEYLALWIHLLMKANHEPNSWLYKNQEMKVERGQFVTSRKSLSSETGINTSKVERILKCFEIEQQIEQQNLFTSRLITIINYNKHQSNEQQMNSKRTASEQQVNTNNNDNNDNNIYMVENSEISTIVSNEDSSLRDLKKKDYNTHPPAAENKVKQIIDDLNSVTGKNFSHKTENTKAMINARIKDGYNVQDFKKVHRIKASQWKETDNDKYLRPSTLYRPGNFESYLNEKDFSNKGGNGVWGKAL